LQRIKRVVTLYAHDQNPGHVFREDRLALRYPGVEIRLVENGSDRLEEILAAGDMILLLQSSPSQKDSNGKA
jgi:hypothetical protein